MKCLVTGGASGLGSFIVKEFAKNNIDVIINYHNHPKEAEDLKKQIKNVNVTLVKCDISNEEEVKKMFEEIDELDYLINNAAICMDKDPLEKTEEEFTKVLKTNLIGPFLCIKYASKKMKKGSILNISSTNAIDTYYPESIDYDASKIGLISLTNNFSKYFKDIRVNCICPDWIDTKMNKDLSPILKKEINFINPEYLAKKIFEITTNEKLNNEIIIERCKND